MSGYNSDLEHQLLALLAKLDLQQRRGAGSEDEGAPRMRQQGTTRWGIASMLAEVRTLDLWRAVIGECLAAVFYVLLVCGAYSQPTKAEKHLVISMVAGFSMAVLVHCFQQVSKLCKMYYILNLCNYNR